MPDSSEPHSSRAADRDLQLSRLLTFVDAVVAIAITLLVLPLVDIATGIKPGESVAHLVHQHLDQIYAFLLSFLVILRLWFNQHRIFQHANRHDSGLSILLAVWLAAVVLLPFPTSLVASAGEQGLTKVLYVGLIAVAAASMTAAAARLTQQPRLRRSPLHPDVLTPLLNTVVICVVLAATLLVPRLEYWPFALMLLVDPLAGWLRPRIKGTLGGGTREYLVE